jgi:hypothetical protein
MLRSRQNDQGGFGLWSSSPTTAEFSSVYAAHVLVEAKEKGQRIPAEVLTTLNGWLMRFVATPASSLADGRLRAYAVYILVRQGIKPDAAISNVEQELTRRYPQTWPTDLAAAYLASTYRLMQRTNDADRIIALVPWSATKRDLGERGLRFGRARCATAVPVGAPFSETSRPGATGRARNNERRYQRPPADVVVSRAHRLALDAFATATAGTVKLSITETGKDGGKRPLTLPAGPMPKVTIRRPRLA